MQACVLGQSAETPASTNERAYVVVQWCRVDITQGGEPVLGAGFRNVRSDCVVIGVVAAGAQGTGVGLGTPAEVELTDVGTADHAPVLGGSHSVSHSLRRAPLGGFVVRAGRAVETHEGMHVDGGALLVSGDPAEGQSRVSRKAGLRQVGRRGEVTAGRR